MQIVVLDDYQQVAARHADWASLGADVTYLDRHLEGDELVAALRPAQVIVAMRERTPITGDLIASLPELRLIVTTGRRNASIDVVAARDRGIPVCGTAGLAASTVEHTWALILAAVRHVPAEDRSVREGGWQTTVGTGLAGRTLGVIGLGRLGSQVAAIGQAFGMDVVAWSQHLDAEHARSLGVRPVAKDELLAGSDVVTIHLVSSARTHHLVGAAELAAMRPTAYLVNTSRGPIVDTAALVEALHAGRIAGAAIDVYDTEPLPADHPLRTAPRTVLTPHLGYVTDDGYDLFFREAVEDIAAWRAGAPIRVL
ncbi:D-2-hydroxyacid dehydrogenase family protein [Aeromicrobium ginsengisoli]|uniref:D-2-hydroxyacid dehydrogenase family protein n=1 Tax=Aeromicrobium ginsengisoli TaxID=363867 RepID=A0A5M4FBR9_9ACTN|nr:D-2-hydroxyacid dehydrogenase family protein [Aeromicrobium ginsengisoli]KAA1395697.1 D-2-hydroxyacid dehydrogenase family protein [Aeromicrobium ginsengisoli]